MQNFFRRGGSFLLTIITVIVLSLILLGGMIPMIHAYLTPPIKIEAEDFENFQPSNFYRYQIEPEASFPINVKFWLEQGHFGATTYRSDDIYYGVYKIGDYYIFHASSNYDSLWTTDDVIIGQLDRMEDSYDEILSLVPDLPANVLPLTITQIQFSNLGSTILLYIFFQIGMIAIALNAYKKYRYFHPMPIDWSQIIIGIQSTMTTMWRWLNEKKDWNWSKNIPEEIFRRIINFGQSLKARIKYILRNLQNKSANSDTSNLNTITIDPKKVKMYKDDK